MKAPRQRTIDIDAHLKDANDSGIREQLAAMTRKLQDSEVEFEAEDHRQKDEEEGFSAQPQMMNKPKGKLSNKVMIDRIAAAEARNRDKGIGQEPVEEEEEDTGPPIRRHFDPNTLDDEEAEEADDAVPENKGRLRDRKPPEPKRQVITNRQRGNPNDPIDPPTISAIERLEKRLAEQQEKIALLEKEKGVQSVVDTPVTTSRLAARRKKYDSNYEKIIPPSDFRFYDFSPDECRVKKIDVPTQEAISIAKIKKDVSGYIDALSSTLAEGVDLRDFTEEDWWYFLYWHKFNSYNRSSLIMRWLSKYGNWNHYSIKQTDLAYIQPVISREDYITNYKAFGLRVPTLRDWEILNVPNDLTEEDLKIYRYAQYFEGDTIEEKVDNYYAKGQDLECIEKIVELTKLSHHGVTNTVDVIDAKFDVNKYMADRRSHIERLRKEANYYLDQKPLHYAYLEEIDELEKEVAEKQDILDKGGQVRPEVETQVIRFDALDIFPLL